MCADVMYFDGYCCRLRTASQSCTNWIKCSSDRPWEIMWTGILSIMWWISCMLYWDSAWSQSLTVSRAGIINSHLNIPKLYHQKEVSLFYFSLKNEKKSELLSLEYTDCIISQCWSGRLNLFWSDHPVHLKLKVCLFIHPTCCSWLFKENVFVRLCLRQEVFCFMTWPGASWNGLFNPGFILNGGIIEH